MPCVMSGSEDHLDTKHSTVEQLDTKQSTSESVPDKQSTSESVPEACKQQHKRSGEDLENPLYKTSRKEAKVYAKKVIAKALKNKVPCPRVEKLVYTKRTIDQVAKLLFFKRLDGPPLDWAMTLLEKNMRTLYEGDGHKGAWG